MPDLKWSNLGVWGDGQCMRYLFDLLNKRRFGGMVLAVRKFRLRQCVGEKRLSNEGVIAGSDGGG